jgi:hypothetical protein
MPEWWLEATVPGLIFALLLVLWIAIPGRPGEDDLGSRIRGRLWRR